MLHKFMPGYQDQVKWLKINGSRLVWLQLRYSSVWSVVCTLASAWSSNKIMCGI